MPQNEELVGAYEVVRLLRLHMRFDGLGEAAENSCLLVSKTPFRLGNDPVTVEDAPATMEQWVGVIYALLVEAGGTLKAGDLFAGCPKLKPLFLKRFPSPGPVLKAGVAANVLQVLKIPGVAFVQLRMVDLYKPDIVCVIEPQKVAALVARKAPAAAKKAEPKKVELINNRAPQQIVEAKVEAAPSRLWTCDVCEQDNEPSATVCILCLVERP
jgi:hypothetical protein